MPDRFPHPRCNRLLKRSEFDQVFKLGSKQVGRHFVCYTVRREEPGNKLGLVVSRKVGKAVTRNRVKRFVRETFRLHQGEFVASIALVVVARAEAAKVDFAACERSICQLLAREGLIRG